MKKILFGLAFALGMAVVVHAQAVWPVTLLNAVLVTGAGTSVEVPFGDRTFQARGATTSGAGAVTVAVQGSNDNVNFITLGTISLTLSTTTVSDGFASDAKWSYIRGNVTAISGTGASTSLFMGF